MCGFLQNNKHLRIVEAFRCVGSTAHESVHAAKRNKQDAVSASPPSDEMYI